MKHISQLQRSFLTFVRSNFDLSKCVWVIIWMKFFKERLFRLLSDVLALLPYAVLL